MPEKWLSRGLIILGLLVLFLFLDGPVAVSTTVSGTLCTDPGEYDIEDVRIAYDRSTMIGGEGVEIRGQRVYYVDTATARDTSPRSAIGEISPERLDRLMSLVTRTGVVCLEGDYSDRFILPLSEPVYESLIVSVENESSTVAITSSSGGGGPARARQVIGEVRTIGRSSSSVNGSEFCRRAPTDAIGEIIEYCNTLPGPLAPERIEHSVYSRVNALREVENRSALQQDDWLRHIARSHSQEMAQPTENTSVASRRAVGCTEGETSSSDTTVRPNLSDGSPVAGENTFRTTVDPQTATNGRIAAEAVDTWRDTPGSRRTMFHPAWDDTGVGVYILAGDEVTTVYITQYFC